MKVVPDRHDGHETLEIVTPSPVVSPVGFAEAIVTVTVVPLSEADAIAVVAPGHTDGKPVAHEATPGAHPGIEPIALKVSVVGL